MYSIRSITLHGTGAPAIFAKQWIAALCAAGDSPGDFKPRSSKREQLIFVFILLAFASRVRWACRSASKNGWVPWASLMVSCIRFRPQWTSWKIELTPVHCVRQRQARHLQILLRHLQTMRGICKLCRHLQSLLKTMRQLKDWEFASPSTAVFGEFDCEMLCDLPGSRAVS